MPDLISRINSNDIAPLLFMIGLTLAALALLGSLLWYHAHKFQIEAALKQDMLTRGMTADEIKKVLEASRDRKPPRRSLDLNPTICATMDDPLAAYRLEFEAKLKQAELEASLKRAELEANLKHEMVKRGMSVDEIRQVLETPLATAPAKNGTPSSPVNVTADLRA